MIEVEDWVLIFAGAVIGILVSFLSSMLVGLFLRKQEMELYLKKVEYEDELKNTKKLLDRIIFFLIIILVVFGLYVVIGSFFGIFFSPSQVSPASNITNVCENCSYPITNIVNNYNYNFSHAAIKRSYSFSVEELKYLVQKRL